LFPPGGKTGGNKKRSNAPPRKKTGRNAVKACSKNKKQQALKERQMHNGKMYETASEDVLLNGTGRLAADSDVKY